MHSASDTGGDKPLNVISSPQLTISRSIVPAKYLCLVAAKVLHFGVVSEITKLIETPAKTICSFGCEVTGDMHHIFVNCRQDDQWRVDANKELVERTELKLANMRIGGAVKNGLLATAKLTALSYGHFISPSFT